MSHIKLLRLIAIIMVLISSSNLISAQYHNENSISFGYKAKTNVAKGEISKGSEKDKQVLQSSRNSTRIDEGWKFNGSTLKKDNQFSKSRLNDGHNSFYLWTEASVYFNDIKQDSLWYVGIGEPIPAQKAAKMDTVYRMSKKLANGKYIHVECLSNNVQKSSEKFCSRLLPVDRYDYDADKGLSWEKIDKNISQIYQYPSADGTKAMEIACDSDGKLIHSSSIEFPSRTRAIIMYYDSEGNIINLTDSKRYKNGTIVLIDFLNNEDPVCTVTDIGGWPIKKNH